jgi:hypothetical protein
MQNNILVLAGPGSAWLNANISWYWSSRIRTFILSYEKLLTNCSSIHWCLSTNFLWSCMMSNLSSQGYNYRAVGVLNDCDMAYDLKMYWRATECREPQMPVLWEYILCSFPQTYGRRDLAWSYVAKGNSESHSRHLIEFASILLKMWFFSLYFKERVPRPPITSINRCPVPMPTLHQNSLWRAHVTCTWCNYTSKGLKRDAYGYKARPLPIKLRGY